MADEHEQKGPRVFISYSWTSPDHELRIIKWAERLVGDGVNVVLDKWDLKEGHDKYVFMEQMVAAPDVSKVLIFSDSAYAKKANERKGGVGTEAQIISAEVYARVRQEKFIPVVVEFGSDGRPCLPAYLASRIFIDFSTPEKFHENYEQLLRAIFDKPLFRKPELGQPPAFLTEDRKPSLPTTSKLELFKNALMNDKPTFGGLSIDYLETVDAYLDSLRLTKAPEGIEFDEFVVTAITDLLPLRNEVIDFFLTNAKYRNDADIYETLFTFFEKSLRFKGPKETSGPWNTMWGDHLDFAMYELFVYLVAVLIRFRRFSELLNLLERPFVLRPTFHQGAGVWAISD